MQTGNPWLALIISLPTRNATARMRVWRGLKALGCGVLRDGVYLLPQANGARAALSERGAEVAAAGGTAQLVTVSPTDEEQAAAWQTLFDRSEDYVHLAREMQALQQAARTMAPAALARKLAALKRSYADLIAIDFFPGAARSHAESVLAQTEQAILSVISPDEPQTVARTIPRLRRAEFRRRTWATRQHPWVDRLASAWLIKRFVDRDAKFLWIESPRHCPPDAVGFDFDGAQFTHVGTRVTFEVLIAAFALEEDRALARLAPVVHFLDTGGVPVEDASGLETILLGARSRTRSDDQLLAETLKIFDYLYSAYQERRAE